VRLSCRVDEVPELRLGGAGDVRLGWSARLSARPGGEEVPSLPRLGQSGGARLGWTTWLGNPEPTSPTAPSVLLREAS
jgi:predicted component of type VI protein secretion system